MDLLKYFKKSNNAVKSAVNSITSIDSFRELKDFFTWGNNGKNIKSFLNSYANNPLVYMVVNKISQTTAAMPRIVIDSKGNEVNESKLKELIENPNSEQSQIEFNEEVNESLLLAGNSYIYFKSDLEIDALRDTMHVLKPDRVEPKFDKFGILIQYDYTDEFGRLKYYPAADVLHIKTSNIVKEDRYKYSTGLSPLDAGWIIIQSSDEKFTAEASIFKNRGIIGVLTSAGDTPMLPEEREQLQKEYDDEMGGATKFNKVKISTTELKYLQTGMTPTDLKLLDGIVSSLRLICGLFGMPSVLFNDTANSSFNNYSTAVGVSYSDVYVPLARKIDDKLSRFLSDKYEVEEYIVVDSTKVDGIKASTNSVAQALGDLSPLLANKIVDNMTPNEVREVVGLIGKDGGDEIPTTQAAQPNVSVTV